jgi:hypothetical protein
MTRTLPKKVRREAVTAYLDALEMSYSPEEARKFVSLEFDLSDEQVEALEQESYHPSDAA